MALFGGRRRDAGGDPPAPGDVASPPAASRGGAAHLGASLALEGNLRGNEDLLVEGSVQGRIELPGGELTVGAKGHVKAEVAARRVVVRGRLEGNVEASERVEVQASGVLVGDVRAPRLVVAEGGVLNGAILMESDGSS